MTYFGLFWSPRVCIGSNEAWEGYKGVQTGHLNLKGYISSQECFLASVNGVELLHGVLSIAFGPSHIICCMDLNENLKVKGGLSPTRRGAI